MDEESKDSRKLHPGEFKFSNTRICATNGYNINYHREMVSAKSLWEKVHFGGKLQIDAKYLNFENFESALYMKYGSMPSTILSPVQEHSQSTKQFN